MVLTAIVIRVAFALTRPTDVASLDALPDQVEYVNLANSLLDGRGLAFYDPGFLSTLYAYRAPGYPLFIAMCGANLLATRVAQAIIDASLVWAVVLLARRLKFSASVGIIAGAATALNPFLIYFSSLILSETLFTAMLVWAMVLMLSPRRWTWALRLLMLALSIHVRPSAVALPVLLAVGATLARVGASSKATGFWRVPAGMTAIALTLLVLFPWAARNRYVLGTWVWTTTNSGITLYDGLNERADGSSNQAFFRSWPELKTMSEVQRSNYLAALAKRFVIEQPTTALKLAGRKVARMWSPVPLSDTYGSRGSVVVIALIYSIPLFALVCVGVWMTPVARSAKVYLLLPALYFTIVHAVTVGSLRYRIPADVPMTVMAASGAVTLISRSRRNDERSINNTLATKT